MLPRSPKQSLICHELYQSSAYHCFLLHFIARRASVVSHLGREIPHRLIFYCINESHFDQTVTRVLKLNTLINLDKVGSKILTKQSGAFRVEQTTRF